MHAPRTVHPYLEEGHNMDLTTVHSFPLPALVVLLALVSLCMTARGLTDAYGSILVDGQPRLVLGLYENPADDARLAQAIDAGFNLFRSEPEAGALDRLHRAGARAWINVGGDLDLSEETRARKARLEELARSFGEHPALLLWEGPDEALWNNWYGTTYYLWEEEAPAMDAIIHDREGAESAALRDLRDRMVGAYFRALWQEAEEARREFWRTAGTTPKRPILRLDEMHQRSRRMARGMTAGIRALRAADPHHMIWMNHAPRNSRAALRLYNREADIAGCDIYPIPYNLWAFHCDLANMRPTSVGEYTERMKSTVPGGSCAMVLQGFGWRDIEAPGLRSNELRQFGMGRRPLLRETRFMAYNAIMHGANAIMYWGTAYVTEEEPDAQGRPQPTPAAGPRLWQDILAVAGEMRALEAALVAPEISQPRAAVEESYHSQDGLGVRTSLRHADGEWVLLVANENEGGCAFNLRGLPADMEGRTLYRLNTPESHTVCGGRLHDGVASFDVHIYATSRRFEAERQA